MAYSLSTSSGQGYTQSFVAIFQGVQDGLDTFFLIVPKDDGLDSVGGIGVLSKRGRE